MTPDATEGREFDSELPGKVFRFLAGPEQRWQLTGIVAEGLRLQKLEREQKELIKKLSLEYGKLQKREKLLDVVVKERTRELQVAYETLKAASRQALLGLAEAIEAKDPYTKGHCGRTAVYAMALGQGVRPVRQRPGDARVRRFLARHRQDRRQGRGAAQARRARRRRVEAHEASTPSSAIRSPCSSTC